MAFFPQMLAGILPQLISGGGATMPGLLGAGLAGATGLGGAAKPSGPVNVAGAASGLLGSKPMAPPPGVLDTSARDEGVFNNFFSTLDGNLESPSKLLALGLLNRQDPRLGAAGLVGMGLLGRRQ